MVKKKSPTNATTLSILNFLFSIHVIAWRQNVLPIPMVREGIVVGVRPGSKSGISDICGIIKPGLFPNIGWTYGAPLYIEVKTGPDKLRPEQIGFITNARNAGAIVLIVKDFEDFKEQWNKLPIKGEFKCQ